MVHEIICSPVRRTGLLLYFYCLECTSQDLISNRETVISVGSPLSYSCNHPNEGSGMWAFALASCYPIPDIFLINSLSVSSQQSGDLNLSSALAVKYQRLGPLARHVLAMMSSRLYVSAAAEQVI